jgi:hypothetical protein
MSIATLSSANPYNEKGKHHEACGIACHPPAGLRIMISGRRSSGGSAYRPDWGLRFAVTFLFPN